MKKIQKKMALFLAILMAVTTLPLQALADDASTNAALETVCAQTIADDTAHSGADAANAKAAAIKVPYAVEQLNAADITPADTGTTVRFYGMDASFVSEEAGAVSLTQGADSTVYIQTTAADAVTTLFYAVTIRRQANAALTTAFGQDVAADTAHTGADASTAKTITLYVGNSVDAARASDFKAADTNAIVTFYGTNADFRTEETDRVTLTEGDSTSLYVKTLADDEATACYYAITVIRAPQPSNDAKLQSVLAQSVIDDTAHTGADTENAKTLSIDVANTTASVSTSDFIAEDQNASIAFYGTNTDFATAEMGSVELTAGAATTVYVKITAENATTTLYYAVSIRRVVQVSTDAALSTVLAQTIADDTAHTGDSSTNAKIVTVAVPYAADRVSTGDIDAAEETTAIQFYGQDASFAEAASGEISLAAGDVTTIYVKTVAEDGKTKLYYVITIQRAAETSGPETANFTDVVSGSWYYGAVQYVVEKGLMKGISDTTFAPNTAMTRAMYVTILYRLAGEPAVSGSCKFTDVVSASWYESAVIWANANGIVYGIGDSTFAPNASLTREQLAALMYRYAGFTGVNTTINGNSVSNFSDAASVSSWAVAAMNWCVEKGLITGMGNGMLAPQGIATRAQDATIITRYSGSFL